MKTFNTILSEILDASQKKEVDTWEKGDNSFSNHLFHKPDDLSITLPLSHPGNIGHSDDIQKHLEPHGYKIKDYKAGLATDKHGRDTKIGKALGATKAPEELKNKFANDPARSLKSQGDDMRVTITRDPHHVAGMTSKGQCWEDESCMNFESGSNKHFLKDDLKHGTHVAYLHHKDDTELEHPYARIAMKKMTDADTGHSILHPEGKTYGPANDAFTHTVKQHLATHLPPKEDGVYDLNPNVYHDAIKDKLITKKGITRILDKTSPEEGIPYDMHRAIHSSEHLTPEHIDTLVDKFGAEDYKSHHKTSPEQVDKWVRHALKTGDADGISSNDKLTKEHIDSLMNSDKIGNNDKISVLNYAKNVTPKHFADFIEKNRSGPTYRTLLSHPALDKETVAREVNHNLDTKSGVERPLANLQKLKHHRNLSPEDSVRIRKALDGE